MLKPSRKTRTTAVAMVCCFVLASTGCIEMDVQIAVNKDLGGRCTFAVKFDAEPMVNMLVAAVRRANGVEDEPTPTELGALRQEITKQLEGGLFDIEATKRKLPNGVTLVESSQKLEQLRGTASLVFAFTTLDLLPKVVAVPRPMGGPGGDSDLRLFESFRITDDGATILIADGASPAQEQNEIARTLSSMSGDLAKLGLTLKDTGAIRATFGFSSPLPVVEHSATRVDGGVYFWEIKADSFAAVDTAKMPQIRVRFAKKDPIP